MFQQSKVVYHKGKTLVFFSESVIKPTLSLTLYHFMTELDSVLKSRDDTLPAKVNIIKAMIFPVVIYGCENWAIKKAEHQIIDAFKL